MPESHDTPTSHEETFDDLLRRAARLTPTVSASAHQWSPGTEVCNGRFRIVRHLGAGGMGVVHQAEDRLWGGMVALKSVPRLEDVALARLKHEFRVLADHYHPNLVRLHELHVEDNSWLFSMEFVPGQPFDYALRTGERVDEQQLRHCMGQLIDGVRSIHAAGKLHRDLKPDNVLVREDGRVVILDFGLVSDMLELSESTYDSDGAGTPAYAAPEQFTEQTLTEATDWYQVGVMLFECLTGRLPFRGRFRQLMEQKQQNPAPLSLLEDRGLDPELVSSCSRMLERDPAVRPSGSELATLFPFPGAAAPRPTHPRTHQRDSRLFGRESELEILENAYQRCKAAAPTLVEIHGDSGTGKSALLRHFCYRIETKWQATVLSGRCYERESVPYKGFDHLVEELAKYLLRLSAVEAAQLLPRDAHALTQVFPTLGRVSCIADAPERQRAPSEQMRRIAWNAFAELLGRICDRRLLVLTIDDWQWADEDSARLLGYLLQREDLGPLLFVLSCRTQQKDAHTNVTLANDVEVIELGPLAPQAAHEMATELLSHASSLAQLGAHVAKESHGNAFLITEYCELLLREPEREAHSPSSLNDAILSRTALLAKETHEILQFIALSGRAIPAAVVANAVPSHPDPYSDFDKLCMRLLVQQRRGGMLECLHDRIRVAVDAQINEETRKNMHARLSTAWQSSGAVSPDILFQHHYGAGQFHEAMMAALEAAEEALAGLAYESAAHWYQQALELAPDAKIKQLHLHERLAKALSLSGAWRKAGSMFIDAAAQAETSGARNYLTLRAATHLLGSGDVQRGMPQLKGALTAFGIGWPRRQLMALCVGIAGLTWLRISTTRYKEPVLQPLERSDAMEALLDAAALVPPYDFARGVYFAAIFVRQAIRSREASGMALATGMLAAITSQSRWTRSFGLRLAKRSANLARAAQHVDLASSALTFSAFVHILNGRISEGMQLADEGLERLRITRYSYAYPRWGAIGVQAYAALQMGDISQAVRLTNEIQSAAMDLGDDLSVIGGVAVITHLARDDLKAAQDLLQFKEEFLLRSGNSGVLASIVKVDRICYALYMARADDALEMLTDKDLRTVAPFDLATLAANCALLALEQGPQTKQCKRKLLRIIRRARRALIRNSSPLYRGAISQLNAGLHLASGRDEDARDCLRQSAIHYAAQQMRLHEQLVHWHLGCLLGGDEGQAMAQRAEESVRASGIVNPERWSHIIAPGLHKVHS